MSRLPVQVNLSVPPRSVERWINQRTWGRLRNLSVERTGDSVIVRGCAGSYYTKQLALAAALESVGTELVVLDIDVEPHKRWIH